MLDGFAVINLFLSTVYPSKTESNLNCIDIPHHAWAVCRGPVHTQPEITHFFVILLVPSVQLCTGVYIKQICYFHF